MEVTLIFGSNMGDRKAVIQEAMRLMEEIGKIRSISSLYETASVGIRISRYVLQPGALYSICLSAENVLKKCMETEKYLAENAPPPDIVPVP